MNRLDWLNQQEQLEDERRGVRIAKNGLLPDLSLDAGYTLAADAAARFDDQGLDDGSYSAGLTLSLPIQQVHERNAYRSAQISLARAVRALGAFRDDLVVSVRSAFRELERRKQSLDIQAQLIVDQERNVKIARLRFEQGNCNRQELPSAAAGSQSMTLRRRFDDFRPDAPLSASGSRRAAGQPPTRSARRSRMLARWSSTTFCQRIFQP